MATPYYILKLREKIGHEQLFLPAVTAVIIRDVPPGAPVFEVPTVLLAKRADNGKWAPPSGICEPDEEVTITAIREVKEEVGLDATCEALLGVGKVGPVVFDNGDECMFMDTVMRLSVAPDAEPVLSDDENTEVGWFSVAQLPTSVNPRHRVLIADAVAQMKHPARFRPRMGFGKRS